MPFSPRPVLGAGGQLGPYALMRELGEGGMGRVFLARRQPEVEDVALKVMRDDLSGDPDQSRRFLREAQALADVRHPNVVEIRDAGTLSEQLYIAMEHLDGNPLDRVVESSGPLAFETVKHVVRDAAAGLDAVHAAGLIHRDIKPSNLMIAPTGETTVMDLGLAKRRDASVLTTAGAVVGTLTYLAPELIRGEPASPASDVYALGCVTFEALTGRPPFTGGMFQVGLGHLEEQPPAIETLRPDAPAELDEVVGFALAKSPAERPATATAFATMLRVVLA